MFLDEAVDGGLSTTKWKTPCFRRTGLSDEIGMRWR